MGTGFSAGFSSGFGAPNAEPSLPPVHTGIVRLSDYCRFDGSVERAQFSAALDKAIAEKATLVGCGRTVNLGQATNHDTLFTIPQLEGFTMHGEGTKLVFDSHGFYPEIFKFINPSRLTFDGFGLQDTGLSLSNAGSYFVTQYAQGLSASYGDNHYRDFWMDRGLILFTSSGDAASCSNPAGDGAKFENTVIDGTVSNSFYGVVTYNNVYGLRLDLNAHNVGRVYFPYGARGHVVNLSISNDANGPKANQAVLLDSDVRDTIGVVLQATFRGTLANHNNAVGFQMKAVPGTGLRECRGVSAFCNFEGVTAWGSFAGGQPCTPFVFWSFDQLQSIKNPTNDRWDNILIDASLGNWPSPADCWAFHSRPTVPGVLRLGPHLTGPVKPMVVMEE